MITSMLRDFTAPYSPSESWIYDRVIAPAVEAFHDPLFDRYLPSLRAGGELLEVGCGGGQLLVSVAERLPAVRLTGLDLSKEQVARAHERTARFGERVRCVQGSALELPFASDRFDAVASVASIKHWPDPEKGLAECVRVLKPGGLLLVAEADRGCRQEDVERFVGRWRMPGVFHLPGVVLFRSMVAGRSFDLDDARAFAAGLPLDEPRVERIEGSPGWLLSGRKR